MKVVILTFVLVATMIAALSSCNPGRTSYRACRSTLTGNIYDLDIHIMYQKGDTVNIRSSTPGMPLQYVVLED